MRRILFQQTDFNTLPNPPAGFNYIGFDGPNFSEKSEDGQISQNIGGTGATGPQGIQGPTGPAGSGGSASTDRLISSSSVYTHELILDNKGTLNIPLLLPVTFNAICDDVHYDGDPNFSDTNWWEFEVEFAVNPNGEVETLINNIFPILTNPGYTSGDVFIFTESDHGIPGFNFELQLNDVVFTGGVHWTANLTVTQPPIYPSTIESLGAIKLTSNSNSLILGTDGSLNFQDGAILGNSGLYAGPGENAVIGQYDGNTQVYTMDNAVGIQTHNDGTYSTWLFDNNGDLNLPEGGDIKDSNGNSVLGGGVTISTILPYLELTNESFIFDPFDGELVSFTKADYATGSAAIDEIDNNLAITRGNQTEQGNQTGIYNPYLETNWDNTDADGSSPLNTLWNSDGWSDLTNLSDRNYWSFHDVNLGQVGNNVLGKEFIMKDVTNNKYYKFFFTVWQQGWGGAVTYTRTLINSITGEDIGPAVEFVKPSYADPAVVNDPIDEDLTLTRGNNQAIYNIALEQSWNTNGDGENSPEGTEWNSDGWSTLKDTRQRTYTTFYEAVGYQLGNNIIGKELVMHDINNNKFYAVKFTSWSDSNDGGGFSYTRQLINTSNYFIKSNYGEEVDIISDGLHITRGEQGWLYNPLVDDEHGDETPTGSLWNYDGWDDLSDLTERTYVPLETIWGENFNNIPGARMVMKDVTTNKYWAIEFLTWTAGQNGGGFSYFRYEIDVEKLNEGIKFADGTTLKSADGLGRVKLKSSGERRIEEVYGSKTVSVTSITTTNLTATASRSVVGDNRIWVEESSPFYDITDNYSDYGIINYSDIEFSIDNTNWFDWSGSTSGSNNERGFSTYNSFTYNEGDTLYMRYTSGGEPQVWWNKNDLPGGSSDFRGAVIDYHAFTGEGTFIGTIHIVDDDGEENISHTEVSSGDSDSQNDDLWFVQNEGTISYRRMDGESKTLKIQWSAKVFYGNEIYD